MYACQLVGRHHCSRARHSAALFCSGVSPYVLLRVNSSIWVISLIKAMRAFLLQLKLLKYSKQLFSQYFIKDYWGWLRLVYSGYLCHMQVGSLMWLHLQQCSALMRSLAFFSHLAQPTACRNGYLTYELIQEMWGGQGGQARWHWREGQKTLSTRFFTLN